MKKIIIVMTLIAGFMTVTTKDVKADSIITKDSVNQVLKNTGLDESLDANQKEQIYQFSKKIEEETGDIKSVEDIVNYGADNLDTIQIALTDLQVSNDGQVSKNDELFKYLVNSFKNDTNMDVDTILQLFSGNLTAEEALKQESKSFILSIFDKAKTTISNANLYEGLLSILETKRAFARSATDNNQDNLNAILPIIIGLIMFLALIIWIFWTSLTNKSKCPV